MGIIALLFLKAGWGRLEKWLSSSNSSPTTWSFDLNSITPGKALSGWVGPEWVNWIGWGVIAILVIILILELISRIIGKTKSTTSGSGVLASIVGWVVLAGMFVWGIPTWKDSRPVGDLEPVFSLSQGQNTVTKLVDIEAQMGVVYSRGSHCGTILGPLIMLKHGERPQADNFLLISQGAGGWWYYTFSENFKKFYYKNKMREPIKVEFRYGPNGSPPTC